MHLRIHVKHAVYLNNISKFGSYLTVDTKRLHYTHEPVNVVYRNNHSRKTYCLLVAFFETPHDNAHAFSFPSHLGVKTREKIVYATCKPVFAASMEFSPCPCHLQRPPAGRTADAILLLLRINSIASHFGLQKDDYLTEHYQLLSFLASSEQ